VAAKMTERTKAILPVHLFGRPCDPAALPDRVPVVEDAAQAFGAKVGDRRAGSLAAAATFSFYPTKNLFGLGDGGLVTTADSELTDRIRLLRFHGSRDKLTFDAVGYNSRLDELQAAALRIFLRHVDEWNAGRRAAAARYAELGLGEVCELPTDEPGHVYHMYVVRTDERERLTAALDQAGIGWAAYYTTPLHLQPALAELGYEQGSLPETERAARETLALPIWPAISQEQQERVVECLRAASTVKAA
jgi:dTDP-4-amino-4,6-dideoxygalactose transaminase